jgi:endoglucanase
MNKLLTGVSAGAVLLMVGGTALAQELPGKFEGVTIDAKLIGGQQYENLYSRISEWENATGATVNVISKKNHFELDKEIKSDIAVGAISWCVGSNHSSFAPQYPGIYTDLNALLPAAEIDAFVDANIGASTLDGKLVMLPRAQFDVSAMYYQKNIGSEDVPIEAFADFWRRLAPLFSGRDDIIYLIMNEPAFVTAQQWLPAANAAIAEVRKAGADNFILVPGTIWTAAVHWYADQEGGSNAQVMRGVVDPMNHYGFDIHQYLDDDYSGTKTACNKVDEAIAGLERVTAWMEETGNRAFLGEFGGHARPDCYRGLARVVRLLNSRPDIWTGWTIWAAGDWWGDYPLSVQPLEDGLDRPQMVAIEPFIARKTPEERSCEALRRR